MQIEPGKRRLKVLIVEDNPDDAALMVQELRSSGLQFTHQVVDEESTYLAALDAGVDVILCDHSLPRFGARRAFEILQERRISLPVVMVSGTINDQLAVEYMQQGAADYVLKDRLARLGSAVRNALDRDELGRAALQASQRLERMMNDLEVGAVTTDAAGHIQTCNEVMWRMFGYPSKDDFIAVPMSAHYVDLKDRETLVARLAADSRVKGCDIEFKRLDGDRFWATLEISAKRDEKGAIASLDGLLLNCTARRVAEQENKTSHDLLDATLDNAPIVLASINHEVRYTFVGGAGLTKIGLEPAAIIGRRVADALKERPDLVKPIERALAGEETVEEAEYRGRYFHIKYYPIVNPELGNGAGFLAVDITERRIAELKAEARARQQDAVRQLAQEALNSPPIAQLMHRAARLVAGGLNADMAAVHEREPGRRSVRKLSSIGYLWPRDRLPIEPGGLVEAILGSTEVKAIEDFAEPGLPSVITLGEEGVKSTLAYAIHDGNQTYGFISAHQRRPHHWTEDDRVFIELVGQTLWVAVERQRLEKQRAQLISRLVDAQEQERRRIAADVHDDAVQVMSAALMRLGLLSQHMKEPEQVALATKLQSTISLSIERLRHLLFELSPPALERGGLMAAVKTLVDEFQRDFGIVSELRGGLTVDPDPAAGLVLYRIIQEAFTNVHKHSHAERVLLTLRDADGGVLVRVEDNGRGFDPNQSRPGSAKHIGLGSMRERAELSGGWWKIASSPSTGTRIEFWIPMEPSRRQLSAS